MEGGSEPGEPKEIHDCAREPPRTRNSQGAASFNVEAPSGAVLAEARAPRGRRTFPRGREALKPPPILMKFGNRGLSKMYPKFSRGFQRFPKISKNFQKFPPAFGPRATRRAGGPLAAVGSAAPGGLVPSPPPGPVDRPGGKGGTARLAEKRAIPRLSTQNSCNRLRLAGANALAASCRVMKHRFCAVIGQCRLSRRGVCSGSGRGRLPPSRISPARC